MVVRKSDYRVSQRFPFMTPILLWRSMAVAGVFVFVVCLLCPPNRHRGGSQLNAAMTLFQSVLLWKVSVPSLFLFFYPLFLTFYLLCITKPNDTFAYFFSPRAKGPDTL